MLFASSTVFGTDLNLLNSSSNRPGQRQMVLFSAGNSSPSLIVGNNCLESFSQPNNSFALIEACNKNSINLVKSLVENGADVNQPDGNGNTPLFIACKNGNKALAKYLIDNGADVNQPDGNGNTPLFIACDRWYIDLAEYLIDRHSAKLNSRIINGYGKDLLFKAYEKENGNTVKSLIENGMDVNIEDENGKTPLLMACLWNNENLAKYLIEEQNANINVESKRGWTPLFMAYRQKNIDLAKYLIEHGADVNYQNRYDGTIWSRVCMCENEEDETGFVGYLINHGANVNLQSKTGWTPLFDACKNGNETLVKYLIEHGADVNQQNKDCLTPLFAACICGNEAIVKYLHEHGANVNHPNVNAHSPLAYACLYKNEAVVKYLVEHGADVNCLNKDGRMRIGTTKEIKDLLKAHGATE